MSKDSLIYKHVMRRKEYIQQHSQAPIVPPVIHQAPLPSMPTIGEERASTPQQVYIAQIASSSVPPLIVPPIFRPLQPLIKSRSEDLSPIHEHLKPFPKPQPLTKSRSDDILLLSSQAQVEIHQQEKERHEQRMKMLQEESAKLEQQIVLFKQKAELLEQIAKKQDEIITRQAEDIPDGLSDISAYVEDFSSLESSAVMLPFAPTLPLQAAAPPMPVIPVSIVGEASSVEKSEDFEVITASHVD